MAAPAATKKRKASAPETDPTVKKPKTAVAPKSKTAAATKPKPSVKSADKPNPTVAAKSKPAAKPTTAKPAAKPSKPTPNPPTDPETDLAGFGSSSESDDDDENADQTARLTGFSSDSEADEPADAVPLASLPAIPAKATQALAARRPAAPAPGVIYISRIPHGFYEKQMRGYFAQFGDVTRLRLARNRRTGASKHHAWLEFAHAEVARIAAETMNNYLLFGHLMKVATVPAERVHPELFKGSERRFRKVPWNAIERTRVARTDRQGWGKRVVREERRRSGKLKALRGLGYEFEAPKLRAVEAVPVQEPRVAAEAATEASAETPEVAVKAIEAPKETVTLDQITGKNKEESAEEKVPVAVKSAKAAKGAKKERAETVPAKKPAKKTKAGKA